MAQDRRIFAVLGNFTPKCGRTSCRTNKAHGASLRDSTHFEPFCVKVHSRVTSVGESRKRIKIKTRSYISRVSPYVPLRPICTLVGIIGRLLDIINCAIFLS